ncbi:MAG: hypothetical protein IPK02_13275 [Candidatus Accumulibacter sp.]|uniref:Uncharacterized protein n=1 Tax=Candidatus Accumulibacter affinis TaxID=2954384 RepID=A0A935TBQ3_9PROT|nr:hypothetical protein [Candidatus Accumulibacter affinis]
MNALRRTGQNSAGSGRSLLANPEHNSYLPLPRFLLIRLPESHLARYPASLV